jgi:hypothetical protein
MAKPKGPASAGLFLERRSSLPLTHSRKLERCDDSATKSLRNRDSTVGLGALHGAGWRGQQPALSAPATPDTTTVPHAPAPSRGCPGS